MSLKSRFFNVHVTDHWMPPCHSATVFLLWSNQWEGQTVLETEYIPFHPNLDIKRISEMIFIDYSKVDSFIYDFDRQLFMGTHAAWGFSTECCQIPFQSLWRVHTVHTTLWIVLASASMQDLFFLKSAWSVLDLFSTAVMILFRITQLKTLLVSERNVMPLQFVLTYAWVSFFG